MAEIARKERLSLEKQNEIGKFRVEVMKKVGEWLEENLPSGGVRKSEEIKLQRVQLDKMPVSEHKSANSRFVKISLNLKRLMLTIL
ncbi:hypothetical protein BH23BAC1_BH23BAC1_49580 [soil metagenome]